MRVIDQTAGTIVQRLPRLRICRDSVVNHNFLMALQAQQSLRDLPATEVRFAKNGLCWQTSAHFNLGTDTRIDIVRCCCSSRQQFTPLLMGKLFPVAIWIKNNSARDGVLLRRIAKDESITEERKYQRLYFYLGNCLFAGFEGRLSEKRNLRRESRRAVVEINRSTVLGRV